LEEEEIFEADGEVDVGDGITSPPTTRFHLKAREEVYFERNERFLPRL
jgi:hypothetical protein